MIEYLWNWYRTRRHISTGHAHVYNPRLHMALCGQYHYDRPFHEEAIRRRFGADRHERIARLDDLPVCKHCERRSS